MTRTGRLSSLVSYLSLPSQALVATYCAVGDEMDPAPLGKALLERGHKLCLPCVVGAGEPLVFRAYRVGDVLRVSAWGIPEPMPQAPVVVPDIVLVPLLGFDRTGNRLGQGGGYYDRTLTALRAQKKIIAIGVAYACQELACVPIEPHDAWLDGIVTEEAFVGVVPVF